MSYDDTKCPCGGKKEPQTMLCRECEAHCAEHHPFEWRSFTADTAPWSRRSAAIKLLAAARRRKRARVLPLCFPV